MRGRGKGSSILGDKSQALHLHRNTALWLRLLMRECDDAFVISVITSVKYVLELMRIRISRMSARTVTLRRKE